MSLSTADVAAQLGCSSKTLRQFLRQDATFGGVGSGSRYVFSGDDISRMKKRFKAWMGPRALASNSSRDSEGQPGLPVEVLQMRDRQTRELIRARSRERVDRLEASLRERGLHVSQIREHASWR